MSKRISPFILTLSLLVIIFAAINSCTKKISGINNNQVVETPFSLFFSDTSGALYSSNDGTHIRSTLFKADGFPSVAICVAGPNIFFGKDNLYYSINNGINFNHTFDSFGYYPGVACNGLPIGLNQSSMIEISSWNRIYTVSNEWFPSNDLGLRYSLSQGIQGTWYTEGRPDTEGNCGGYGINMAATPIDSTLSINMSSLTMLANQVLCGYDARHNRNFYKTPDILWKETTSVPTADTLDYPLIGTGKPSYYGLRLPHHNPVLMPVDTSARYSYGHFNNRLIAIDQINCNNVGAYYSDDTGKNWYAYSGLPNKPMLCVASPFEEVCFIGTDSAGLWVLNNNTGTWTQANNGLGTNLVVRNIAFKENIYKDASIKKFIYLATNKGIYMSSDLGANWTLTIPGNFVTIY